MPGEQSEGTWEGGQQDGRGGCGREAWGNVSENLDSGVFQALSRGDVCVRACACTHVHVAAAALSPTHPCHSVCRLSVICVTCGHILSLSPCLPPAHSPLHTHLMFARDLQVPRPSP